MFYLLTIIKNELEYLSQYKG